MALVLSALLGLAQLPIAHAVSSLKIDTTSGTVQGAVDSITPKVAHFLGVPFAEQPLGKRRWLPSIPKTKENGTIDASHFGPACPQFEGNTDNVWLTDAPEFVITPRNYTGEDCLTVNVWTPWREEARQSNCTEGAYETEEKLPVIAWIHGGSFQTGASTVPYQDPSRWIQRSGKHIVVGIQYVYFLRRRFCRLTNMQVPSGHLWTA
jgi:acetylcholinesterase